MLAYVVKNGQKIPDCLSHIPTNKGVLHKTTRANGAIYQVGKKPPSLTDKPLEIIPIDDNLEIWIIADKLDPISLLKPNNIGKHLTLGDGNQWLIPKLASYPENIAVGTIPQFQDSGTELDYQYFMSGANGGFYRVTKEYQSAWQKGFYIFGWLSGTIPFTDNDVLEAFVAILSCSYYITKYDLGFGGVISKHTSNQVLEYCIDWSKWVKLAEDEASKKNSLIM